MFAAERDQVAQVRCLLFDEPQAVRDVAQRKFEVADIG